MCHETFVCRVILRYFASCSHRTVFPLNIDLVGVLCLLFVNLICVDFVSFNHVFHFLLHPRSLVQSLCSFSVDICGSLPILFAKTAFLELSILWISLVCCLVTNQLYFLLWVLILLFQLEGPLGNIRDRDFYLLFWYFSWSYLFLIKGISICKGHFYLSICLFYLSNFLSKISISLEFFVTSLVEVTRRICEPLVIGILVYML